MDELISRQAAINALMAEHETLEAYMEECLEKECFASRADAKTARNRIEEDIYILENLPSAQPEIIRCKDCMNWDTTWQNDWAKNYHYCPMIDRTCNGDWYCADAERRTDE